MERFKPVTNCRCCESTNLIKYLSLGEVPPCNSLLKSTEDTVERYPIEMLLCKDCFLSQLSVVVDPAILFKDYVYHSSVSKTFREHCCNLVERVSYDFNIDQNDLIVDIASNDGCLLKQFKWAGFKNLVGIEPAENLTESYDDLEIGAINKFFSFSNAKLLRDTWGMGARIITAQNVLAHVDGLDDFLRGVSYLLREDGVFVAEFPHMMELLNNTQIDTIYHEHLSYFLLKPLIKIFGFNDLTIFHAEQIPIHGGSLRIYACKDQRRIDHTVGEIISKEVIAGCYDELTYNMLNKRVCMLKETLLNTIIRIRQDGKKIMGFGASAKGISLLNYFGINDNHIHSIVDETPDKIGKWTPGSNIPIVGFAEFEKEKPDYILLLAWNFAAEMCSKTSFLSCQYIIPIPDMVIV